MAITSTSALIPTTLKLTTLGTRPIGWDQSRSGHSREDDRVAPGADALLVKLSSNKSPHFFAEQFRLNKCPDCRLIACASAPKIKA
jgi:hypothetical protein